MPIKFSVVIATYNQVDYLLQSIKSVVNQTFKAHEVIVIADGCTDATVANVRRLYPDVILIEQNNLGKCIARNTGIGIATGDWICLLDHDDLWHRDKLKSLDAYLQDHPECAAISHPVYYFAEDVSGPTEGFGFQRDFVATSLEECHAIVESGFKSSNDCSVLNIYGQSFEGLRQRRLAAMSASSIRRDVLLRAGLFCPTQFNGEDWSLFQNVARLTEWHYIDERLAFTRLLRTSGTYEQTGGLMLLTSQLNAWFTGRPLIEHTKGLNFLPELDRIRLFYRNDVQDFLWAALKARQFKLARLIWLAGSMLLLRFSDRAYVLIPPALTWRWDYYIRRGDRKQRTTRKITPEGITSSKSLRT